MKLKNSLGVGRKYSNVFKDFKTNWVKEINFIEQNFIKDRLVFDVVSVLNICLRVNDTHSKGNDM